MIDLIWFFNKWNDNWATVDGSFGKVVNRESTFYFYLENPHSHWPFLPEQDSLSVVLSNPSTTTTAAVLEIIDGCQGFMLVVHNVRQPVLCCGDGVSVEHMVHCFHARCNGATPVLHLERLVDALVEFQKEIIRQQANRQIIITFKQSFAQTVTLIARDR